MTGALLDVAGLSKRFGGFVALSDVSLRVGRGERLGLIGPNGSGKSTLVNCICGTLRHETGTVTFNGHRLNGLAAHRRTRLGMARSFQLPRPFHAMTLAENVQVPILYAAPTPGPHGSGAPRDRVLRDKALALLELVGLADKADHRPADLTQIEMRKLELAKAMASNPTLLIADEVMAGLSHKEVDEILALLMQLNETGTSFIMIEHIMRAVMAFSQRLVVLVAGRKIADGAPSMVIRDDAVVAYLGS
ncbi:ABC transporter ATP-binding protein [Rhodopila sp.]|jgi:branched-chain amino acid transport system ATP-binding protein|uniref:ABC transporter ATP-binding protein n=1 Tax=Rhodopila sp. TaxID=2480087 RepID=UPI002B6A11FC|nr:ABC transporter ATP-binding protein [Rhodopila sp.]HVZ06648.1 ABC transporter ATP-binding protein [Rhodopila sp.]